MATKYICDRCGGEDAVEQVKIIVFSKLDVYADNTILDEDLCIKCRRGLETIANKFINKDDVVFVR